MAAEGSVEVRHVWKRFRSDRGRRLLRDHVGRAASKLTRRDSRNPWRWVLRDIDFKIEPGEAVGFVGVNGAGKSTLLKIISGVMFPHSGRVSVDGRIGALLEVASGIHPELTGRENVNIFGTLLGLSRGEIAQKFDEIVAFAELETAIDRQVKFYSSGMKTRLGFSIAAFLEPDVLVVDEVLAVGDQIFQQKCLDRMRTVLDSGATLLLVSHDLASVGATASRGIWLSDGLVRADGAIDDVLSAYRSDIEMRSADTMSVSGVVKVSDMRTYGPAGGDIEGNGECHIEFSLDNDEARRCEVFVGVTQGPATPIFVLSRAIEADAGRTDVDIHIPRLPLPSGNFYVWVAVRDHRARLALTPWQPLGPLYVTGHRRLDPVPRAIVRLSPVYVEADWETGTRAMANGRASGVILGAQPAHGLG
jgi:ABC-type polysaccharide/polyol phosphate transport system ATPase subunit